VLDCACNCGGYSFWAKEFGASECFGFDVRQHWIDQARFLAENRTLPSDGISFEVCDLYDLPKLELEPFDVTIFKGIFYHLPDPITGLKIAADLTKELLILETATKDGLPDGMLAVDKESPTALMSGVYGLMWLPTGPEVLTRILKWMGFPHTKVVFRLAGDERTPPSTRGRIQMVASRQQNLLEDFE
jgi:tRNA (mo5U34)-methyltransferase